MLSISFNYLFNNQYCVTFMCLSTTESSQMFRRLTEKNSINKIGLCKNFKNKIRSWKCFLIVFWIVFFKKIFFWSSHGYKSK